MRLLPCKVPGALTFELTRSEEPALSKSQQAALFDDLVGAAEQWQWHGNAECLSGVEVQEQLDFGGLLHRQIAGLLALEHPAGIDAGQTVGVGDAATIARET